MSSYKPLADFLASKEGDQWDASFEEVERALGRPLPQSAYRYNAWWANQTGPGHSQTKGWRSVGWRTAKLDLERKRVRFERERREQASRIIDPVADLPADQLVGTAMALSGLADERAVIDAALRTFIREEVKRGLIALGGSQPDFEAAPRKRPWS